MRRHPGTSAHVLLAAHWPRIRACYQAELELKGRQWACAGVGGDSSRSSVVALLGSNRAGVLAAARLASTTTELARAAGVSLAAASEHATILRNAGLITSTREGRRVSHAVTWLGQQLLHGDG